MSEKEKKPAFKWLEKLKNVKHIEIYVAIIFIVIILLIYFSNIKSKDSKNDEINTKDMTVSAYIDSVEAKLEECLSSIAGISDVNVMITLNLSELEVNNNTVEMNTFPDIKGVLVTAKGVNDTLNKMKVLHAIEAVIDIKNGNIEILSSE